MGAVIRIVIELSFKSIQRWKIQVMNDHSIVIGSNRVSRAFIRSERNKNHHVVLIESDIDTELETYCDVHGVYLLSGDCQDKGIISLANLRNASNVIVCTGDNSENMSCLLALKEQLSTEHDVNVFIQIDDEHLLDRLEAQSYFDAHNHRLYAFNLTTLSARKFVWSHPIYAYADLMGQQHLHFVFVGFDGYAEALLKSITTSFVYRHFSATKFTILCKRPDNIRDRLRGLYPSLDNAVAFEFHQFDEVSDILLNTEARLQLFATPVSSMFTFADCDDKALSLALRLKQELVLKDIDDFPLFIRMDCDSSVSDMLVNTHQTTRMGDMLLAFGMENQICDTGIISGELEQAAKRLHDKYSAHSQASNADAKVELWENLSSTLKDSNRRAVDHLPAKLYSAGAYFHPHISFEVDKHFSLLQGSLEQLERLSELEQKSWTAGRYVDGWVSGETRNNKRKIHHLLGKSYSDLDESIKEYDRDQIKLLDNSVLSRTENVSNIGKLEIAIGFACLYSNNDATTVNYAPKLIEAMTQRESRLKQYFVSVYSALASQLECELFETLVNWLELKGIQHRCIVVGNGPECETDSFSAKWGEDNTLIQVKAYRDKLIQKAPVDWVISDGMMRADKSEGSTYSEKVLRYIVSRTHILVQEQCSDGVATIRAEYAKSPRFSWTPALEVEEVMLFTEKEKLDV